MRWLIFGRDDGHGYVSPWNPLIAERHAKATERLLLGHAGPAVVEDADARRRAQFWREVEQKQARGRVLLLRRVTR